MPVSNFGHKRRLAWLVSEKVLLLVWGRPSIVLLPFLVLLSVLGIFPAATVAQEPTAVLLAAPDLIGASGDNHALVERFLRLNTPRVLAVAPNGAIGWQAGGGDAEWVEAKALESCTARGRGSSCRVAIRDLAIVIPDHAWTAPGPPTDIAMSSANRDTIPDARFLWWGPRQARGVLVFAHGKSEGVDSRGAQPQSWTRHFNNAGFDIWRFDRNPAVDRTRIAATWLREDLAALRRLGYRRIIMSGQSRGAWNTMMMLDQANLIDVGIAISPAAHGRDDNPNNHQFAQIADMKTILRAAIGAPQVRLAVVNFRNDHFVAEADKRADLLREFAPRFAGFLLVDRPEGLSGHGAGATSAFNDRYGACLLRFATAPLPPSAC